MSIIEIFVKIKIVSAETEPIPVKSGLKQGTLMSPNLINLILEKLIREMDIQPREGVKLRESVMIMLAYADDVVLINESHNSLGTLS